MSKRALKHGLIAAAMAAAMAAPGMAQNLFAPVVRVNDSVITTYEIEQRVLFLQLLNAPGATRATVTDALIDDRLRAQAVSEAGLNISEEGVDAAMTDFAARGDLTKDEFILALADAGVSEETFRDFVVTSASWIELIRARYGPRVSVSEDEIDQALSATSGATGIRVLVSEIIIPAPPEQLQDVLDLAEAIALSESEEEFSSFAREFSATASRDAGGRLPWQSLTNLPPTLRPIFLSLSPGDVTDPLPIPNAVALFQLRDIQETSAPQPVYSEIDYAIYYIPGGRSPQALSEAARIRADVDVCNDLYAINKGQPPERLVRNAEAPGAIPRDIAIELSKLDPGEMSTTLTSQDGQSLALIMMCGRTTLTNQDISREDVERSLRQQRLEGYASSLLGQLRADARIEYR